MPLSLEPQDLATVVCRPALPQDTPAVLEFTKKIWEGNDYVPFVWEDWLRDPLGLLAVAEYAGKVVGICKLTFMAPGEWWLEGLRVDPEHQGRKVASHLHEYIVGMWEQICDGVLRLTTTSNRYPVHHLCERTGFYRRLEVAWYAAETLQEAERAGVDLVLAGEIGAALDYLAHSSIFQLNNGLVDRDWHWEDLKPAHLEKAIAEQLAFWMPDRQGLLVLVRETDEDGEFIHILAAACEPENLVALLAVYRQIAGRLGFNKAFWSVPVGEGELYARVLHLAEQAGFQRDWDINIYVFEKPVPEDL